MHTLVLDDLGSAPRPGPMPLPAAPAPEAPGPGGTLRHLARRGARATAAHATTAARPLDPEALYAEFQPLVRRLVRQYAGADRELQQDIAGEIYYRFRAHLAAYDPSRAVPLKPYLVRQITASAYTYARQQWRARRREVSWEATVQVREPGAPEDPTPEWDAQIDAAVLQRQLPELIAALPERQRRVLISRYYDQTEFEEIASALGITPATARSLLRHALANLRRRMADQPAGGP